MVILILFSFMYGIKALFINKDIVVYYSLFYRMFELNIGGLLKLTKFQNNINEMLLINLLIILPFSFHCVNKFIVKYNTKLIVDEIMLLFMIIICSLIITHKEMKNIILNNRIIKYLGKCSYIIYLVHYPLLELLPTNNRIIKISLIILSSVLLYEIYDRIIQDMKMSVIQMIVMNILFFLIPFLNSYICYTKYEYYSDKLIDYKPVLLDCVENRMSEYISSIVTKEDDYKDRVIPLKLHNFDKQINYSSLYENVPHTVYLYFGDIICDFCNYYPKNFNPKQSILVVGDSYAIQWLWIIRKYAYIRNISLKYIFTCHKDIFERSYVALDSYFHIIIPIFSCYYDIVRNTYDTFLERYKEYVYLCSKMSDIIIAFTNHPMSRLNGNGCICGECISRRLPRCYTINGINSTFVNFPPMLSIPNFHIINVTNELCVNGVCSCVIDDYLVYDDMYHINPSIILKFYSKVENELDKILKNEFPVVRKYNASDKCSLIMMNYIPYYCKRFILPFKSITRDYNDYFYNYNKYDY